MASGLAIVAFDYGATREHLVDGSHGAAVPAGDADAFVRAVTRIGAHGSLFRMGVAARAAVQHLHPDEVAREFAGVLGQLAQGRRAA